MTLQYVVGDKVVSIDQLMETAEPVKREQREEKSFFKGWRVEGFKPGQIAQSQKCRDEEIARFDREREKDPSGTGKRPKPFDLNHYIVNTRRTPLRAKPYELREAAELCKRMAEKDGWEHVVLVEIKKVLTI